MTSFPPFILYLGGWQQSAVREPPAVPSNVIHLKEKMIKKVRVKIRSLKNSRHVGIYKSNLEGRFFNMVSETSPHHRVFNGTFLFPFLNP